MKKKQTKSSPKKQRSTPNYTKVDGAVYEKLSSSSVEVELDLEEPVYNQLNDLVESGKFVSIGDAVRHILRSEIEKLESKVK